MNYFVKQWMEGRGLLILGYLILRNNKPTHLTLYKQENWFCYVNTENPCIHIQKKKTPLKKNVILQKAAKHYLVACRRMVKFFYYTWLNLYPHL